MSAVPSPDQAAASGLGAALAALDDFLAAAVEAAEEEYGPHAAVDGLRGLHLSAGDVRRTLDRPPGAPLGGACCGSVAEALREDRLFRVLIDACGLTDAEAVVLLIALAPEVDSRYERIYAFLQDDVTRRRPTLDLVMRLLAGTQNERRELLTAAADERPLGGQHLLVLDGEVDTPLPARTLRVDGQIVRLLLGAGGPVLAVRLGGDRGGAAPNAAAAAR